MSRINGITRGGSLIARIVFFFSKRKVGKVTNPIRIMALNTPILWGYGQMELGQEKAKGVSHTIKLLADLRIATLVGCPFWIDIGSAGCRKLGVTEDKLQELSNYESSSLFSSKEKVVLRYADAMSSTPVVISDEMFNVLSEYFNESQIVELTSAIAWENYRSRFDHALKIESQGFSKGAFSPLPIKN